MAHMVLGQIMAHMAQGQIIMALVDLGQIMATLNLDQIMAVGAVGLTTMAPMAVGQTMGLMGPALGQIIARGLTMATMTMAQDQGAFALAVIHVKGQQQVNNQTPCFFIFKGGDFKPFIFTGDLIDISNSK